MASLAESISRWRAEYVEQVSEKIANMPDIFPEYEIQLKYYRGGIRDTPYASILAENFERDQLLVYF